MMNVYKENYKHIDKLTGGLLNFISSPNGYLKLKSQPYMDLTIERIGPDEISLTHYYEQNGDLVPDPDMQVRIDFQNETAEALTCQDWICFRAVYPEPGKVNLKLKKDLNFFLLQWLKGLKKQGFYK